MQNALTKLPFKVISRRNAQARDLAISLMVTAFRCGFGSRLPNPYRRPSPEWQSWRWGRQLRNKLNRSTATGED